MNTDIEAAPRTISALPVQPATIGCTTTGVTALRVPVVAFGNDTLAFALIGPSPVGIAELRLQAFVVEPAGHQELFIWGTLSWVLNRPVTFIVGPITDETAPPIVGPCFAGPAFDGRAIAKGLIPVTIDLDWMGPVGVERTDVVKEGRIVGDQATSSRGAYLVRRTPNSVIETQGLTGLRVLHGRRKFKRRERIRLEAATVFLAAEAEGGYAFGPFTIDTCLSEKTGPVSRATCCIPSVRVSISADICPRAFARVDPLSIGTGLHPDALVV